MTRHQLVWAEVLPPVLHSALYAGNALRLPGYQNGNPYGLLGCRYKKRFMKSKIVLFTTIPAQAGTPLQQGTKASCYETTKSYFKAIPSIMLIPPPYHQP